MDLGLKNKVALVTGGSQGIGLETAVMLAKEGAQVAICARNEEQLKEAVKHIQEQTNREAFYILADMKNKADCQRAILQTVEHYGRLDVLINNAGTSAARPFEEVETESWSTDFDLKLFGAIHCSQAALPYMKQAGGGAIINVTASLAKTPPASSLPTSVSRSAGMALTKAMSKDLGKYNIRVNAVCIGLVRSAQIERRWKSIAPDKSWEEFSKDMSGNIPLGRIGRTEEAAKAITFLASEAASYITGTALNIDGGSAPAL